MLERVWGCRLATYGSYGACWSEFPTGPMGHAGASLACRLATYMSYGACWSEFGDVFWQPTGLMGHVGATLGLQVGSLQVLWGMLARVWGSKLATDKSYGACWSEFGCLLATYRSYGACWSELRATRLMGEFGAVGWQPTCLMGHVGACLGLQVGSLQVLWGMLEQVWGCRLATYRSYGACWSWFGAVGWQPTGLMGHVGASLGV